VARYDSFAGLPPDETAVVPLIPGLDPWLGSLAWIPGLDPWLGSLAWIPGSRCIFDF